MAQTWQNPAKRMRRLQARRAIRTHSMSLSPRSCGNRPVFSASPRSVHPERSQNHPNSCASNSVFTHVSENSDINSENFAQAPGYRPHRRIQFTRCSSTAVTRYQSRPVYRCGHAVSNAKRTRHVAFIAHGPSHARPFTPLSTHQPYYLSIGQD